MNFEAGMQSSGPAAVPSGIQTGRRRSLEEDDDPLISAEGPTGKKSGKNASLNEAKRGMKDEFYTPLADIEKELAHYPGQFRGKIAYCNCDDPAVSNFFKYFSLKFAGLGLKKLITTCCRSQGSGLFSRPDAERAIKLEYDGFRAAGRVPNVADIGVSPLPGAGDFRSAECIDILKEADVVVTNPPFSLFREYVAQLIEHDKRFLIIGNLESACIAVGCSSGFTLFAYA